LDLSETETEGAMFDADGQAAKPHSGRPQSAREGAF
jgi:hypothetical protein